MKIFKRIGQQHYASSIVSAAIGVFVSAVIVLMASRLLTIEELGTYFTVLLITQITTILIDLGTRNSIISDTRILTSGESDGITSKYLIQAIIQIFASTSILLACACLPHEWIDPNVREAIALAIPCSAANILFQNGVTIKISQNKASTAARLQTVAEIQRLAFSFLALLSPYQTELVCLSLPISRIVGILLIYKDTATEALRTHLLNSIDTFINHLTKNFPIYATSLLSLAQMKIVDISILYSTAPLAQIAIYNLSLQIPSVILRVTEPLRPILQRQFIIADDIGKVLSISVHIFLCLSTLMSSLIILFSTEINRYIYAYKLSDSTIVAWLFAIWLVPSGLNLLIATALIARGGGGLLFRITLYQIAFLAIPTYAAASAYGAEGAAGAMLLSAFVSLTATTVAIQRSYHLQLQKPLASAAFGCAFLTAIPIVMEIYHPGLTLRSFAALVITATIIFIFQKHLRSHGLAPNLVQPMN